MAEEKIIVNPDAIETVAQVGKDRGFKSREFILSAGSLLLVVLLPLVYPLIAKQPLSDAQLGIIASALAIINGGYNWARTSQKNIGI